jgi:hypothetical protein
MTPRRESENFLASVAGEQKSYDQAHNAINRIRETTQRVHPRRLFGWRFDVKILTKERRFEIADLGKTAITNRRSLIAT